MKNKNNNNKNWESIHAEASKWSRWIALYEAINCLADKAEEKNIKFEKIDLKPLKILEYIKSTENLILRKLLKKEYNIDICYSEMANKTDNFQYSP